MNTSTNTREMSTAKTMSETESECPGCLRPKNDEDYTQTDCRNCGTEMCNQCYSVSPVEGDDECYCKRCAQVVLDEYEKEHTCEVCNATYDDEDIVGCCRDGKCETKVETMCRGCGTWDEETEQWRCPDCIPMDDEKGAEVSKETHEMWRQLGERLCSEDAETAAQARAEVRRLAGIVE